MVAFYVKWCSDCEFYVLLEIILLVANISQGVSSHYFSICWTDYWSNFLSLIQNVCHHVLYYPWFSFFFFSGSVFQKKNEPLNLGDPHPEFVHFYYRENNNKKGKRDLHQECQGHQLQSVILQNPSIFVTTSFYLELKEACSPQLKVLKIGFSMVGLICKRGVCHFVTATCNKYLTKCRVSGYRLEIMN